MNRSISSVLRNQAKAKGITQGEIARAAGVSLPTIKRWLTGRGLDLERLEQLLGILGLSLLELATLAGAGSSREFEYSVEQEKVLAQDPSLLAYLNQLLLGASPRKIQRAFRLGERRAARILHTLERIGLLERHPEGKIRLRVQGQPRWRANGPLFRALKRRAVEDFLAGERLAAVRLGMHRVNMDDYRRLEVMLADVQDFARTAESRARSAPDQPTAIGLLVGLAPFEWKLLSTI